MIKVEMNADELRFLCEVLSKMDNASNSYGLFQRLAKTLSENEVQINTTNPPVNAGTGTKTS